MKITILDKIAMGDDTPFDALSEFGTVKFYETTNSENVIEHVADSEIIILNKVKITEKTIMSAPKLKLICVFATGYDNIDIEAARNKGVAVCNVPGYSTESVVLFTIATTLALVSHLNEYNEYVRTGAYSASSSANKITPVVHEISGMTWGIVGGGNIGKAVARVAEALGARVIINKRTPSPDLNCVSIEQLCKESDIITLHCPLNDGTYELINDEMINLMKPGVVLVNEARGAVVSEKAVANAILNKKIAAFGCDVYSQEPFKPDHPYNEIKDMPNVILTPHSAWGAYEARERCVNIIAKNISSFIKGERNNRVD
jgi:glycerate dehydrogenase